MRVAGLAGFLGISFLSLLAQSAHALAEADCKAVVAPSPFGPDDQTGATNRVTPAVTKAAAAAIRPASSPPWPTTSWTAYRSSALASARSS